MSICTDKKLTGNEKRLEQPIKAAELDHFCIIDPVRWIEWPSFLYKDTVYCPTTSNFLATLAVEVYRGSIIPVCSHGPFYLMLQIFKVLMPY